MPEWFVACAHAGDDRMDRGSSVAGQLSRSMTIMPPAFAEDHSRLFRHRRGEKFREAAAAVPTTRKERLRRRNSRKCRCVRFILAPADDAASMMPLRII